MYLGRQKIGCCYCRLFYSMLWSSCLARPPFLMLDLNLMPQNRQESLLAVSLIHNRYTASNTIDSPASSHLVDTAPLVTKKHRELWHSKYYEGLRRGSIRSQGRQDQNLGIDSCWKLRGTVECKIHCFVGPSDVGKTSISHSHVQYMFPIAFTHVEWYMSWPLSTGRIALFFSSYCLLCIHVCSGTSSLLSCAL